MNSKSTQIWTTLRHLTLVCVVVVGVLSILATGGGSGGGGGGGGGGGVSGPTLADLAGTWIGSLEDPTGGLHTTSVTIDGSGNLTQQLIDGVNTGLTGTISKTSGSIFNFVLSDGTVGGFIVDASVTHAGFLNEFFTFGAVQKSATGLPTYVNTDIVGIWSGFGVAIDSAFNVVQTANSIATVASNFSFTETNSTGTTTGVFLAFAANFGVFTGTFTSSTTTGVVEAFLSADKTFAATWTCDTTDNIDPNVGFPVDCSFFIFNKQ